MKQSIMGLDPSLMSIASDVCAKEEIEFQSLDARAIRGLTAYWCSNCGKIHPLNDLAVTPRRIRCGHCQEQVRLYSNSNKFGKLRRAIFYRLVEMGMMRSTPQTSMG